MNDQKQKIAAFKKKYKKLAPGSVVQLPAGVTIADLDGWKPGCETDPEKQDDLDREVLKLIARFKQDIKFSKDKIAVIEMDAINDLFPPVKTWWGAFKPLAQFMTFAFERGLVGKYIPRERKVILKEDPYFQESETVH